MKTTYHHGDLRTALLTAGDEVLRDSGFKGFTLRECARRAGVSHAAPKYHFGDVTGFLTEIAALAFDRLEQRLRKAMETSGDLGEEFQAISLAYVKFAVDYPEHFRLMFRCDLLDTAAPSLDTAASATLNLLTNVILRQREETEQSQSSHEHYSNRPKAEKVIADIVIGWCHVHGFAHLCLEQQLSMMPADLQESYLKEASLRLSRMIRSEAGSN